MATNYNISTGATSPPDWLVPYLQTGAARANQNYNPAGSVAPFSQATQQYLDLTQQRATQGSAVNRAAQGYATGVLGGNYLPGGSQANPYLDATFNQAALATQNQLASQFSGSGRNIGASYAPRADQLNNLATNIYGGAYDAERNRQQQAAQMAPGLAAADYADLSALGNVGSLYDQQAQRQLDAPNNALNTYLSQLGDIGGVAGRTTSQSTPEYTNTTANVLGTLLGVDQLTGGRLSGAVGNGISGLLGGSTAAGTGGATGAAATALGGTAAAGGLGAGTTTGALGSGAFGASGAGALNTSGLMAGIGSGGSTGLLGGATGTAAGGAVGGTAGGAAATGAGLGASTSGAAIGANLATLGPIGLAIGAALGLRAISDVDRSQASGTTDPYAGLFTDMGYGGLQGNDPGNADWQSTVAGVDPSSGIRWEEDGGKTTYYLPDGTTYIQYSNGAGAWG